MSRSREVVRGVVNTELVADKTVRDIEQINTRIQKEIVRRGGIAAIKAGLSEQIGIPQDVAIAAMIVWNRIEKFRYTEKGAQLTIRELNAIADDTRGRFLQQHVINHIAYFLVRDFYDWLVDKNLIARFSKTESYWRKLDADFKRYQDSYTGMMEMSAKALCMDHISLWQERINPLVDRLEICIRDFLIQHRRQMQEAGQKDDIATIQKVSVCMYFLAIMQSSFVGFFSDIVNEHGVDFSVEFRYADLHKMTLNFVFMCEAQGVKFVTTREYERGLLGVETQQSVRIKAAWKAIVDTLSDEDLNNQTAGEAIGLNEKAQEEYSHILDEYETQQEIRKQQEMEEGFKMLAEKFKVTKENR